MISLTVFWNGFERGQERGQVHCRTRIKPSYIETRNPRTLFCVGTASLRGAAPSAAGWPGQARACREEALRAVEKLDDLGDLGLIREGDVLQTDLPRTGAQEVQHLALWKQNEGQKT